MGVDFTAYAAIGVLIRRGDALVATKTRVCHHGDAPGASYCPVCGKPMWTTEQRLRPRLAALSDSYRPPQGAMVLLPTAQERSDFVVTARLARADARDDGCARVEVGDVALERERLRGFLEPLGLWDESKFGMWAVAYVSC